MTPLEERRRSRSRPDSATVQYLALLAGERADSRLIEIRFALADGRMGRTFISARAIGRAAELIAHLAGRRDVYTGVALRCRRAGGRDAITDPHLVFIETDTLEGLERLRHFAYPPSMVIASGTPGHLHAYWSLASPISVDELERANRRLAHHLGGDPASVDAARVLRPPGSLNHKHQPPAPVRLLSARPGSTYRIEELAAGLQDPAGTSARHPRQRPRHGRRRIDQQLLAIPAGEYVRALAGRVPDRAEKVSCPFHDDRTPSLQLYEDGTWYCFGCRQGGSIYDFAARLWGTGTKRGEFLELRARLAFELRVT